MKDRVQAVLIKDKKVLVVWDDYLDYFSPPTYEVDEGQEHEDVLKKRLEEDYGVHIKSVTSYFHYYEKNMSENMMQIQHNYLIEFEGEVVTASHVNKIKWITPEDVEADEDMMHTDTYDKLILTLRKDSKL
jgi:ADP-ribose pyrophosphatase YjhB (NUDIX family)